MLYLIFNPMWKYEMLMDEWVELVDLCKRRESSVTTLIIEWQVAVMYKTVRQGDASLQYTILPQIDQFYANEGSTVGCPPIPMVKGHSYHIKDDIRKPPTRGCCLTCWCLGLLIGAIFICGAIAYIIDHMVAHPCEIATFKSSATDNDHLIVKDISDHREYKQDDDIASMTTSLSNTSPDNQALGSSTIGSTSYPTTHDEKPSNFEYTITGKITRNPSSQYDRVTMHRSFLRSAHAICKYQTLK